ncbi:MAG: hypothetical protein V1875_06305 [Candidatus Altiarchaeota archaeon]
MGPRFLVLFLLLACLYGCLGQNQGENSTVLTDLPQVPASSTSTPEVSTTSTQMPTTTTTSSTIPPLETITTITTNPPTTMTAPPTTVAKPQLMKSDVLAPLPPEDISFFEKYAHGRNYIWSYKVPSFVAEENARINVHVTNKRNITFHIYIMNETQTTKCWKSPFFTDCRYGVDSSHSITEFDKAYSMNSNWSVSIDNAVEGTEFTINWTIISPSENTSKIWTLWNTKTAGCLYNPQNGSAYDFMQYRGHWTEKIATCGERCCLMTDHRRDKNITWYQKCYSSEDYRKIYNRWPFDVEFPGLPAYYVWEPIKYKDSNCADVMKQY